MNGLAGCYVSTIGKPHEYFDLTRVRPAYRGAPVAESRRRTTMEPDQKPAAPDGSPLMLRVPIIMMMKDTQPMHRWVLPQSSVGGRRVTCSRC